tara:strand:- start:264 stop:530 length:267 start_codon:yes stop_codon:yes gene_type:complete
VFFSLCIFYYLLLSFVEHAKAPLNTAHSQETRRHGAFSLSLSLSLSPLFASRFARTKEVSTHRARDRADAVVARLGFARAMAFFFPRV